MFFALLRKRLYKKIYKKIYKKRVAFAPLHKSKNRFLFLLLLITLQNRSNRSLCSLPLGEALGVGELMAINASRNQQFSD